MNSIFVWKSASLQDHVNWFIAQDDSPGANVISMHVVDEGPGAILRVLRHFLSLINDC